jgi:hypothetical protein
MGITMTENINGTWWGWTRVPSARPSAAPVSAARGATVSRVTHEISRCTSVTGSTAASGKTMAPATRAWRAPETIFSTATAHTGSGASTRSSISRV